MGRGKIVEEFTYNKRKCVIVRMGDMDKHIAPLGSWHNGYVEKHKRTKHLGYDQLWEKHGGDLPEEITFDGCLPKTLTLDTTEYWGFDTVHYGDDAETQNFEAVRQRTIDFAKVLIKRRL